MKQYERYTTIKMLNDKVYLFDKVIFSSAILLLLILFSVFIFSIGADSNKYFYVSCKYSAYCENPLYNNVNYCGKSLAIDSPLCTTELLKRGEHLGTRAPYFLNNAWLIAFTFLFFTFLLNHKVWNKDIKFKDIKEYFKSIDLKEAK